MRYQQALHGIRLPDPVDHGRYAGVVSCAIAHAADYCAAAEHQLLLNTILLLRTMVSWPV